MRSRRSPSGRKRRAAPLEKVSRLAKSRRHLVHKASLLDLPDNVLVTILELLQKSAPQPYYARNVDFLRHSYALASTCKRLLSLFGSTLHSLDAQQPISLLNRGAHLPACVSPLHLTRVVTYAAHSLRILRLPRFFFCRSKIKARQLLKSVAQHCPFVRELSFVDEGLVNTPLLGKDLIGVQLRRVEICGPGVKILKALRLSSCQLTDLHLLDVDAACISELEDLLNAKRESLVHLRLGVDLPFLDLMAGANPQGTVETFLSFLDQFASRAAPCLKSLEFEAFMVNPPEHLYAEVYANDLERLVAGVASFLGHKRDNAHSQERQPGLKFLRVHGVRLKVADYLRSLQSVLSKNTTVEVECPGAAAVFPPKQEKEEPYFRTLQLANAVLAYQNLFGNMLRRVERLELSTSLFSGLSWPQGVKSVVSKAAEHIQYVGIRCHLRFGENSWEHVYSSCSCIAGVLSVAPKVEVLAIPSELGMFVNLRVFYSMLHFCHNLRVLHLYESGLTNVDAFTGQREPRTGPFVACLPEFLRSVRDWCSNLRCIYLEEAGNLRTFVGRRETRQQIRNALEVVSELESSRPCLDAGTVRAHLEQWLRPPY